MPPETEYKSFSVASGNTSFQVGDPETRSFSVPTGELWYVEAVGYAQEDGNNKPDANLYVGVSGANDPATGTNIRDLSRGAESTGNTAAEKTLSLGSYAYGKETVFAAVNNPKAACTGFVMIRRVL